MVEGAKLAVILRTEGLLTDVAKSTLNTYCQTLKPDITLLTGKGIHAHCNKSTYSKTAGTEACNDIHRACLAAMWFVVKCINSQKWASVVRHLQRYFAWIKEIVQKIESGHIEPFSK